ncbi:hypothetical protein RDn1_230 [Candidatus Termititenax dinenymphae]|uniref:Uncharacterized protein n=1 Tax=Candidatus Termititenax dinenymphae TaxID=2218523 RepID=A0A388TL46_9BACT|nr:hypothetical protein RDn1_230 [Candidatus Termititenax dinenymphae]
MLLFLVLVLLAIGLIVNVAKQLDSDSDAGGLEYGMCAGLGFIGAFGSMDYLMFGK